MKRTNGNNAVRRVTDHDAWLAAALMRQLGWRRNTVWLAAVILLQAATAPVVMAEADDAKGVEFFEKKIRPVLVEHCYKCHAADAKEVKSGLLLDTREGIRRGGDMGHAVVAGNLEDSLLISALEFDELEMPPSGKLPDSVIADFKRWVKMGAPDPRDGGPAVVTRQDIDFAEARKFWAFRPVRKVQPPKVNDAAWPVDELDNFVRAALHSQGLKPVPDADRYTWLRRVYYDLIGLPPTPEEIEAFVKDRSPQAFETVVDRLLASPHFGERWGRHWLDVVRYAESMGRTRNYPFPHAWRYRDYVIRSFNADKPYDRFVREQVAGDLLPAENPDARAELLTATGFLALGAHDLNQRDREVFTMDVISEQIDVVSRALMGITLACARCHDHKFDPIPTRDYYAMAGIFRSTELLCGYGSRGGGRNRLQGNLLHPLAMSKGSAKEAPQQPERKSSEAAAAARAAKRMVQLQKQVRTIRQRRKAISTDKQLAKEQRFAELKQLASQLAQSERELKRLRKLQSNKRGGRSKAPQGPHAMGVRDAAQITDCQINIRGDAHRLGDSVPRGFLTVVALKDSPALENDGSGRKSLAEWLTRDEHPLTARVIVNRIWHNLMGRGIVATVDNFGRMGERPTHPELLDYLAARFAKEGWSVKNAIRHIVLSRTYRLGTNYVAANYEKDPDNRYLWRMNRRRLEVEAIRDAILLVGGNLQLTPPARSAVATLGSGEIGRQIQPPKNSQNCRTVYLPVLRGSVAEMLTTFDFPEPSEVKGRREVTTVATQALYLMNNPLVSQQARAAAQRLLQSPGDDLTRVQAAHLQVLSRPPDDKETQRLLDYVAEMQAEKPRDKAQANQQAWVEIYHALIASAEFRYR